MALEMLASICFMMAIEMLLIETFRTIGLWFICFVFLQSRPSAVLVGEKQGTLVVFLQGITGANEGDTEGLEMNPRTGRKLSGSRSSFFNFQGEI